nr:hypothetical protein [Bacteroidota bacterium]
MKKILLITLLLYLVSCSNTSKYIQNGEYDRAIHKLVLQLQDHPENKKMAAQVNLAWQQANDLDLKQIKGLKLSGRPDIWDEVFETYQVLEKRQSIIQLLPVSVLDSIGFTDMDYSVFLEEAREKACLYFYAEAKKLIESDEASDHQKAYNDLLAIEKLIPGFRDVPDLLEDFHFPTLLNISYFVKFDYPNYMPGQLIEEFEYFDPAFMNTTKYAFFNRREMGLEYKYHIDIIISDVGISPENTTEVEYTETAEIQDGIAYKLDAEGMFVLDSTGNKIEVLKLKSLACYVTETLQKKSMIIGGSVYIFDLKTKEELAMQKISGESRFFHRSAKFKGDLDALSPETFGLVGSQELDYPEDLEMMLRASDKFKVNAMNYILQELDKLENSVIKKE